MVRFAPMLLLVALPGCATIWMGPDQTVRLETNPAGATCTLDRTGVRVGEVPATPGSLLLSRSASDLWVTCSKPGYSTVDWRSGSAFNGVTLGNLAIGGVLGLTVDAVTGANFNYADTIRLELPRLPVRGPLVAEAAPVTRPIRHRVASPVKLAASTTVSHDSE